MKCFLLFVFNLFCLMSFSSAHATVKEDMFQFLKLLSEDTESVYVLEEKIELIEEIIDSAESLIRDGNISDKQKLAELLTSELAKIDKHFSVTAYPEGENLTDKPSESYWEILSRKNSGFQSLQLLEGNVGFLNLTGFDKVYAESVERTKVAMSFFTTIDCLIIDLRSNGGGSPDMVSLLAGYFFENEVALSSIYERASDETIEFKTEKAPQSLRRPKMLLYILTSEDTFSAAEAFAYDLQHYKRAVVVGETTGGGANPIRTYLYDEGFMVSIPYAKAVNPVTGDNWEGIGVKPDIETTAEEAFDKAYCLALKSQESKSPDTPESLDARQQFKELKCM